MMGALLLKDWYMTKKYCRYYIFVMLVFIALSFASDNVIFYTYPCMLAGFLPCTLYAYDEREKFTGYCAAMPVSRRQYVNEKYVFGLICSAAAILLTVLAAAVKRNVNSDCAILICMALASSVILQSVMFPLEFKFGAEKGRGMFIAVIAILIAASYILLTPECLGVLNSGNFGIAALALCVALLILSWLLSQKIYAKKEF